MILPAFNETDFGKHPIFARMLKEIFRSHPAWPRYMVTYNPDLVLNFLKALLLWDNITLKWLTFKTITILAILSGHRCQPINSLTFAHIDININKVIFYIPKTIKNITRSFRLHPVKLKDESICPVRTVVEYIKATEKIRKSEKL